MTPPVFTCCCQAVQFSVPLTESPSSSYWCKHPHQPLALNEYNLLLPAGRFPDETEAARAYDKAAVSVASLAIVATARAYKQQRLTGQDTAVSVCARSGVHAAAC